MEVYISTLDDADTFSKLCEKYKPSLVIDVHKGRYMVDGCSILGVISFSGYWVQVDAISRAEHGDWIVSEFYEALKESNIQTRDLQR